MSCGLIAPGGDDYLCSPCASLNFAGVQPPVYAVLNYTSRASFFEYSYTDLHPVLEGSANRDHDRGGTGDAPVDEHV